MIEPSNMNYEKRVNSNDMNAVAIGNGNPSIISNHNQDSNGRRNSFHRTFNYLNNLLKIQCLFGVTYCGNTFVDFDKRLTLFWKACLVCYDLILVVLFMSFEYFAFTDDTYNRTFDSSQTNKMIMNIIFSLSAFAMAIEFSVIKVFGLVRGRTIISNLMAFGQIRSKSETKSVLWIYLFVILMCTLGTTQIILNFAGIHKTFVQQINSEKILFFVNIFIGFVYGVTKSSTLVLMMYSSIIIRQQLTEMSDLIRTANSESKAIIQSICHRILEIRRSLRKMYSSLGFIVIVKVFVNGILLSSGLCGLAKNFNRDGSTPGDFDLNGFLAIGCFCLTSMLDLFAGCYASQLIIDSMTRLCQNIESRLLVQPFSPEENDQLKVVLGMRKTIKYNVLGLFDMKTVTILIVVNYAANFAVILIQTQ